MSMYVITNHEEEALRGLPHLAQLLYYKLRARMNFQNGIVGGLERAVSWFALREDLDAWGGPGVKRDLPSEDRVRRAMGHLIKKGLVAAIGSKLRLRFQLLKAKTVSLAPKKPAGSTAGPKSSRKAARVKASRACPQGNSASEAAAHQEVGKTLNPPPTPSGLRPDGDGTEIDPPAPAAHEDHNPNGDETPGDVEAHRLSEERHEPMMRGGGWPAAGNSDEEAEPNLTWEAHLAWPSGIEQRQRAYIARSTATMEKWFAQLLLDEWHGAMLAGVVKKPWPYFNSLLKAAKEQGHAWKTKYAEGVEIAREEERARLANLAAQEAAYQASLGRPGPLPAGALGQFARAAEAEGAARRAERWQ